MQEEIWKDIPEYEGLYQASNLGRIKSFYYYNKDKKNERILKNSKDKRGYYRVNICKNKKILYSLVHRLVLSAFLGESKLIGNHINGIKTDNRLENLEYCTQKENMQHAHRIGLIKYKLNKQQVKEIKLLKNKMQHWKIALLYNISRTAVTAILNNRYYDYIK